MIGKMEAGRQVLPGEEVIGGPVNLTKDRIGNLRYSLNSRDLVSLKAEINLGLQQALLAVVQGVVRCNVAIAFYHSGVKVAPLPYTVDYSLLSDQELDAEFQRRSRR
ncbi:hypothetical protein V9K67_22780 [Paraflavisolibacter sp. H34]|uniref:hypothetical protein n=1 Tax=Huijunlia imazamoxiresistens TaxID=3127457 RepID=UPI0030175CF2